MSRLPRGRVLAGLPAVLVVPLALAAAPVRAADDFVQDDASPPAAPQPRVMVMPPLRLQMRQQAAWGGAVETRQAAYLGVATRPLAPELRAQIELPAGVGLLIDAVSPDSPAARAGVKRFDVLHKFDDQIVCAAEQLTALVEAAGKDKVVTLTVLRGGREQVMKAALGEREVAVGGAVGPAFGFDAFGGIDGLDEGAGLPFDLEAVLGGALPAELPGIGVDVQVQVQQQVQEALAQAREALGANAQGRLLQIYPGGRSQSMAVVSDGEGSIEIRDTDGQRTVTIKDSAGQEVYSGPLAGDADQEKIPEAWREKVRSAEGRVHGRRRQPGQKPAAEKPAAAEAAADEI